MTEFVVIVEEGSTVSCVHVFWTGIDRMDMEGVSKEDVQQGDAVGEGPGGSGEGSVLHELVGFLRGCDIDAG